MAEVLVVLGATGQQGSSVIKTVQNDPELSKRYRLRGTTRNAKSASDLSASGVEVVEADANDIESLKRAFAGASVVFASTVTIYDGRPYEHEMEQGKAIADAAVHAGVKFLIYSSLPHASDVSGGKYKNMGPFNGKYDTEQYIRSLSIRSAFFAPGCFMSNFATNSPPRPLGDGTYAIFQCTSPETKIPLIDVAGDTGKWVAAVLHDFDKYEGKVFCASTAIYTWQEIVDAISHATGKTVVFRQIPEKAWRGFLPPPMQDPLTEMWLYIEEFGYYGKDTAEKVQWAAENAYGRLSTFEEYLKANPLKLE
jgi:uncharacterized protein YbjT (DUF2867 family)